MSTAMQELLNLFEIDSQLVQLKKRLDAGPQEIQEEENKIAAAREERRKAESIIKEKASELDNCNLDIRTAEAEIDDQQEKLKGIKNNKEYKIVTTRIKDLKQLINDKETLSLQHMEELEQLRNSLKEKLESVTEAEKKIEELKLEVQKETDEIKVLGKALKEKREPQVKKVDAIDPNAMEAYRLSLRRGQGIAMAEMKNAICQSCFRKANANIENVVITGTDIKKCICAGCGRILYAKSSAE
ncbi:MAG: hypothetical protein JXR97_13440 [Planctomycetes bacterium]|nr:hypothetical protein [Planctomycetota bacterium]